MLDRDRSHASPRVRGGVRRTALGLLVAAVVSVGLSYSFDLPDRLGLHDSGAAAVPPPAGLVLPEAAVPGAVAEEQAPSVADRSRVRAAVSGIVRNPRLGARLGLLVTDLADDEDLLRSGPRSVAPASTMKLLTAEAALAVLGADHRFETSAVRSGRRLVLVGGGDPLLARTPPDDDTYPARADLTTLARRTASALRAAGLTRVRLGYDDTLFTGPSASPAWEPDYVSDDVVSPITSLWADEGRRRDGDDARSTDPARAAADYFARRLHHLGVEVTGRPMRVAAPADAEPVASVTGAPLSQVVEHVLETSDNEGAEVLARQVAVATGDEPSFEGAVTAVQGVLSGLRVDLSGARIHDGSGLARSDRLRPETLVGVLEVAYADPFVQPLLDGLPVAGFTGSLAERFDDVPRAALGMVRAKTGTLTGVSGLAGIVTTRDGAQLAFVAIADRVAPEDTLDARHQLDRLAAALAACACAS